jgi:hypothetical protein
VRLHVELTTGIRYDFVFFHPQAEVTLGSSLASRSEGGGTPRAPRKSKAAILQNLFDVSWQTLSELAQRKIIREGSKRGLYLLSPTIMGYVKHLRELAMGRGRRGCDHFAHGAAGQACQSPSELAEVKTRE